MPSATYRPLISDNDPGLKALIGLETDLEFLERVAGPKARVMALNKLRARVRTESTREIWAQTRFLPTVDSQGRKLLNKNVPTGIKQAHIRNRVRTSKATKYRPYFDASTFVKRIPVISLHKNMKGGGTTIKGTIVRRKSSRKRSSRGGIKIGTAFFPNSFLQITRQGGIHVFMRKQYKTWRPGTSGWGRPAGTTQADRMPYTVHKIDIEPVARQVFPPTVARVVEQEAQIEFNRALVATGAKILKQT